jgi:3-dehydroquinate synthase
MRTRLYFLNKLDGKSFGALSDPATSIVIYDRKLASAVPGFKDWLKRYQHSFAVTGGEKLKSLEAFERESTRIHRAVGESVTRSWTVLAIGGGSVGDFAGFFASVYKRGLRLVHVPTTWLAAIDSSHGGKTALNLLGAKNQIGTFYPAMHTVLVRSLLTALPEKSFEDALGEFAKIALLDGRKWTRNLKKPLGSRAKQADWLWRNLPSAIDSKLRIVRRDPLEIHGDRQLLNLGHTFGHVIEAERGLAHGRSVALGLLFAVDVSEVTSAISTAAADGIRTWLAKNGISRAAGAGRERVSKSAARKLLRSDKKRADASYVWFIVLAGFGKAERRRVDIELLLEVADQHGWLR